MTPPAHRKMSPADSGCRLCDGLGFVTRPDGGAGAARFCSCRFRVIEDVEEPAPQALLDLERVADRLEKSHES